MKRGRRLNAKGMSMITAVLALLILSLAMAGLANGFYRAMFNNGSAGGITGLQQYASQLTEAIMLLPDNDARLPASGSGTVKNFSPTTDLLITPTDEQANFYQVTTCKVEDPVPVVNIGGNASQLLRVTVIVDYNAAYYKLLGVPTGTAQVKMISYRYRA